MKAKAFNFNRTSTRLKLADKRVLTPRNNPGRFKTRQCDSNPSTLVVSTRPRSILGIRSSEHAGILRLRTELIARPRQQCNRINSEEGHRFHVLRQLFDTARSIHATLKMPRIRCDLTGAACVPDAGFNTPISRYALASASPSLSHGIRINSRNRTLARAG